MASIREALRQTSKGKLQYCRSTTDLKYEYGGNEISMRRPLYYTEKDCLKANFSFACDEDLLEGSNEIEEKTDSEKEVGSPNKAADDKSPNKHKTQSLSCPVSPEFGLTTVAISDEQKEWKSILMLRLLKRKSQMDAHDRAMTHMMNNKRKEADQKIERWLGQRSAILEQKLQESNNEALRSIQRLKDDHTEHSKKIASKTKEIEMKRLLLEEEEKKRRELELNKLQQVKSLVESIKSSRQTFMEMLDKCSVTDLLPDVVPKLKTAVEQMSSSSINRLASLEKTLSVTEEDIKNFEDRKKETARALEILLKHIAETEKKKQEQLNKNAEEEKKREEAKKLAAQGASDMKMQSLTFTVKKYETMKQKLEAVESSLSSFVNNAEMKKYRFDLQRAVNTPINAISPISGAHLRDKLQRLHSLVSGQRVEVSGRQVSASDVPEGVTFCQNLVARMLVRKGEEQVTSKHDSAFAIGTVVVGMWQDFPLIGDLFLGHLQALCPYVLPIYQPKQDGQTNEQYHQSLGYKILEDGKIEEQDKFLKRMSGLMRLYCACLVSTPPRVGNSNHPHGLENAWMWLTRTMNLDPYPDVTAAMIYDVLNVTGFALLREYRTQFAKLVYVLYKSYLPKLQNVSVTGGTVSRLETFLETVLKNNGRISPPDGLLSPNFWHS